MKLKRPRKGLGLTLYFILVSFLLYLIAGMISTAVVFIFSAIGLPIKESFYENLYMIAFIIFVGTLLAVLFSRYFSRPFQILNEATKKVTSGDFEVRIKPNGPREAKEMAESFNAMAKELGGMEALRSDFVSNVSHEFKTPAASIKGFAKLAKKEGISADRRSEYLDYIVREADRLAKLAENVLLLSRLEQEEIAPKKSEFLLDEQLRRAALLLEPQWSGKDIGIFTELATAPFAGYEELLMQAWINLLGNALKFTDEGGKVEISLRAREDGYAVCFADNGIGMDDETANHVFEKFFQGDTSRSGEGSGLGLALTKRIVEMSGGTVSIKSALGQGTAVTVLLPVGSAGE